jgi:hypothetical protein
VDVGSRKETDVVVAELVKIVVVDADGRSAIC